MAIGPMHHDRKTLVGEGFFVQAIDDGEGSEVVVSGELDLTTSEALEQHVAVFVDPRRTVVLDLREVTFMDSTGLRALWTIQQHLRASGGGLVLRDPSQSVARVLALTHLEGVFDIVTETSP